MNPKNVLNYAAEHGARFVSVRFTDLLGAWHHLTYPIHQLTEDSFEDGFGFDGSSLRGWAAINESDMLLIPDPARVWIDPFAEDTTICLIANVVEPITKEGYHLDPRSVAVRAESYLKFTGIADTIFVGPEAEFFVFDNVSFHNTQNRAGFTIDSEEGHWNTGREGDAYAPNLGYHIRAKEGYVPVAPLDSLIDLRNSISRILGEVGIHVECHHHEVATAGQCEIDFKFSNLLHTADNLMLFKYVVKNTAVGHGKTVTFMPKPLYGDNGSGMHCHQSLWKDGQPLFAGDQYAGLSEMAKLTRWRSTQVTRSKTSIFLGAKFITFTFYTAFLGRMRFGKVINAFIRILELLLRNFLTVLGWVQEPFTDFLLLTHSLLITFRSRRITRRRAFRIDRVIIVTTQDEEGRPISSIPSWWQIINSIIILNRLKIRPKGKNELAHGAFRRNFILGLI